MRRSRALEWLLRGLAGAVLITIALAGAAMLAGVIALAVIHKREDRQRYDRANADYRYITSQLDEQGRGRAVDLSKINGGDWQFLCVIGAYNDPIQILHKEADRRQLKIDSIDPVPTKFLGIAPVEEGEGAISFIDGAGHGRTILIDGFQRLAYQHDTQCFGRETREIILPLR